jgi:hypothetical protein
MHEGPLPRHLIAAFKVGVSRGTRLLKVKVDSDADDVRIDQYAWRDLQRNGSSKERVNNDICVQIPSEALFFLLLTRPPKLFFLLVTQPPKLFVLLLAQKPKLFVFLLAQKPEIFFQGGGICNGRILGDTFLLPQSIQAHEAGQYAG